MPKKIHLTIDKLYKEINKCNIVVLYLSEIKDTTKTYIKDDSNLKKNVMDQTCKLPQTDRSYILLIIHLLGWNFS